MAGFQQKILSKRNKMKKYYLLGLLIFGFSGCVVNDTLTQVNKTLGDTTSVLSSTLNTVPEQDISHLIPKVNDDIQKQQIINAKPTIQKVLSLVACTTDSKGTVKLNKYATDNYVFYYKYPTYLMKNHISGCTKITRISKYQYIAKNAFSFETTFESLQSGEVARINFEIQKQPEGDWLFSKIRRE